MAATTYVMAGSRAGRSAIVWETTTKTYATALAAILAEAAAPAPGVGSATGYAITLA